MGSQDLNIVMVVGRLTKDAELSYLNSGTAVMKFSIAVNRKKKSGDGYVDEVSFFDCTLFGKQADAIKSYMVKPKQIAISGELRQNRWEQDGQKRSKVEIIANNVQLLGGDKSGQQAGSSESHGSSNSGVFKGSDNF